MSTALADWRAPSRAVIVRPGQPLGTSDVIVGSALSRGYSLYPGVEWTTLVVQPVDRAFAPIYRMGQIFLVLFGLILVFTMFTAVWVSRRIAAPIVALTDFARGYVRGKVLGDPPAAGGGEVAELSDAFVSMVRDIALSQQHLVRASKLAVVGEMSAAIAHEVRTPLGILRSSAQMLGREANISPQGRELVGFIESETQRLNRLVSAMLDAARPRAMSFSQVDIHELIHASVAMLSAQAEAKGVAVSVQFRAVDPTVQCDKEQMTQVLLNILLNALQILARGGRVGISTRDTGSNLCIEIADDGPGIDPADRARVFEAFFFQREGGIGLGLAIVQQIVASHGGDIEVAQSELGGALFRIVLPREQPSRSR